MGDVEVAETVVSERFVKQFIRGSDLLQADRRGTTLANPSQLVAASGSADPVDIHRRN